MIYTATQPHNYGIEGAKRLLFASGGNDFDTFAWDGTAFRFTDKASFLGFEVSISGVLAIHAESVVAEITLPDFPGQRIAAPLIEAHIKDKLAAILKG